MRTMWVMRGVGCCGWIGAGEDAAGSPAPAAPPSEVLAMVLDRRGGENGRTWIVD